ncbi:MAG: Scr1 family TA system antitoxin-like transcriptional regulator [Actinomycetota bacterium]|nr:Scr1 family TA system antitoxin-like transcriptional regulator [Actinomycetota bacterium]
MGQAVQTIPRVFLGEALKQLRSDAGKTLDDAAKSVGKDRARLIKVLEGTATLSAEELRSLVDFLDAPPGVRDEIIALGVEARKRPSDSPYIDLGPGSHRRIAWLEAMAKDIWIYDKGIYPHLVHSPEYVDALMGASENIWWEDVSGKERANRAAFRLERQRMVLDPEKHKQIDLMFTDDALTAEVGSPEIMRIQLAHVIRVINEYPNVTIRVVPGNVRDNPAQHGGLTMLRFGDVLRPVGFLPVVYGPSTYFDKVADTERLLRAFNKLRELALSPEKTWEFLESKLKEG